MFVPLKYPKKKSIPNEVFDCIADRLLNKYDLGYIEDHVKDFVRHEIGDRYKDYRARLCRFYRRIRDPIESWQHPHGDVSVADWNMLCDRWENNAWKERSAKCKASRSKVKYNHCAGTKSFMAHREENKREDGTYLSPIELFHHTHWSAGKGWTSPIASEQHQQMVALQEEQAKSSTPMVDEEIMSSILGTRKSYVRGMGYEAKPPSKKRASYSQDYVQSLETQLEAVKAELAARTEQTKDWHKWKKF